MFKLIKDLLFENPITSNYYYGARYGTTALTSIWLPIDTMADMYPGWSPYNYGMQNPVNMVDPRAIGAD